jgi:hypothetical protein
VKLVRNLGAPLNDVRAAPEQSKCLFRSPYRTGKSAGLHNPLDPLAADFDDNSEQAIPELIFRRFIDKERGIKIVDHTDAVLSTGGDSATHHFAERSFATALMQIKISARREAPRALATRRVVAPIAPAGSLSPPDTP